LLARKGGFLSGGQQQQLACPRAAAEPKLLILDDPPKEFSQRHLADRRVLRTSRNPAVRVLLVEQYLEFALTLADSYYVMEKAPSSQGALNGSRKYQRTLRANTLA